MSDFLSRVMVKGVIFDLDTRAWRGAFKLTAEDLGLDAEEMDNEILSLGRGWLAPKSKLQKLFSILNAAGRHVYALSVPFPIYGTHYVPVRNLRALEARLEGERVALAEAVAEFVAEWETVRAGTIERWTTWAETSYDNSPKIRKAFDSKKEFVESLRARIEKKMPTATEISESFAIEWSPFQITIPTSGKIGTVNAGEAEAKLAAFEKYEAKWDARVKGFVETTAVLLRERLVEVSKRVAEKVAEAGTVKLPTLKSLKTEIDEIRSLNFFDDAGLDDTLDKLSTIASGMEEARYEGEAEDAVVALSRALGTMADKIAGEAKSSGALAVENFGKVKRTVEM